MVNMVIANHMFEHVQNWTNLICTQSYMYSYKENQGGFFAWHCLAPKNADEVPKIIKKLKGCQTITYKYLKVSTEIWSPHVLFERKPEWRSALFYVALCWPELDLPWLQRMEGLWIAQYANNAKFFQLSIYQSLRDYLGQEPSYLPTQLCGIICNPAVVFCIFWGLIYGYRNKNSAHMPECK